MTRAHEYRTIGHSIPAYVPDDAPWPPPGLVSLAEIKGIIRAEVAAQLAAKSVAPTDGQISTTEAMAVLGYADRKAFLAHARNHGLPYQRLSSRKFRWSAAAIHAHQARRTVGKART